MNKQLFILFLISLFVLSYGQKDIIRAEIEKDMRDHYEKLGLFPLFDASNLTGEPLVANRYVVLDDIFIDTNKTFTVIPGTMLYMAGNKKIIVKGRLQLQGNSAKQISINRIPDDFLSEYESETERNWDGIYVDSTGDIEIEFCKISGSNFGIVSKNDKVYKHVNECMFSDNKFSDLKLNDKEYKLKPGFHSTKDILGTFNARDEYKNKKVSAVMKIISGAVTIAGGSMIIVGQLKSDDNYKKYKAETVSKTKASEYYDDSVKYRNIRNAGIACAGVGVLGFTISFVF